MWTKLQQKKKNKNAALKNLQHSYFKGHECSIPPNKQTRYYATKRGACARFIFDLIAVRNGDIRARYMFRSYAALSAERFRQQTFYPFSIHPYSKLRIAVEVCSLFLLQLCTFAVTWYYLESDYNDTCELIIALCEGFYLFNIIINIFTGYVEGYSSKIVVLDLKKIAWQYLKSWLIVDLTFCLGLIFPLRSNVRRTAVLYMLKILKIPTIFLYAADFLEVIQASELTKTAVETTISIGNYLLWTMFFQFATEYLVLDNEILNPRNCSWLTVTNLWNASPIERKIGAISRAAAMLQQNANINIILEQGCFHDFFVIIWRIGKLVMLHCAIKYLLLMIGLESAKARYFIMTQQLQLYMNHRRFPSRIQKKILKFYAVRFQSHFFVENRMMECLSGRLREDIIMHTGRQLVREAVFLKQLPRSLLLRIGIKLKLVIFLAGDIIFKINTVGDCIYFIYKGTVAIYSESGQEIGHLQDGDFFGEVAMVIQPQFRTTSAVAVTNCELFRLDKKDFDSTIAMYPTVYEDIKKVAFARLERTIVMDKHHKAELKIENEDRKSSF